MFVFLVHPDCGHYLPEPLLHPLIKHELTELFKGEFSAVILIHLLKEFPLGESDFVLLEHVV